MMIVGAIAAQFDFLPDTGYKHCIADTDMAAIKITLRSISDFMSGLRQFNRSDEDVPKMKRVTVNQHDVH